MGRGKLTTEIVVSRFKKVHGDKYDYSKVVYLGSKDKVIVVCPKHGNFSVILDKFTNGSICPKCDVDRMKKDFSKTTGDFVDKSTKIHGGKYDYSLVNYINNKTKVTIICPTHGEFNQRAGSHMCGYGCLLCKETMGERDVRLFLEQNNITFIPQNRISDCKNIKPLPFDFYLPKHNTCIEFNGKQHYEPNHFFVSSKGFDDLQHRDGIKVKYCNDNNINLITIRYDDDILSKLTPLLNTPSLLNSN